MFILRQLEFGLFDFRLHAEYKPEQGAKILETRPRLKSRSPWCRGRPRAASARLQPHLAGGYAAGYYSYLWADVLAADAFSRFEEEGIFNRETGQSFLDNILSRGGSEDRWSCSNASAGVSRSWTRCWSITGSKADCYVKICLIDETGAGDGALSVLAARWGWSRMTITRWRWR